MPIVSRTLIKLSDLENTTPGLQRWWRIEGVDRKGRRWRHGPFFETQAKADAERDTAWPLELLRDKDKQDLLKWVQKRNKVANFDYADRDISQAQGEDFVFRWFAGNPGGEAITVAWWLDSLASAKVNSIRGRLGYSARQATDIIARSNVMTQAEPSFDRTERKP